MAFGLAWRRQAVVSEVPTRFEALAEALVVGGDVAAVCTEIGTRVAHDGASLHEALDELHAVYRLTCDCDPSYDATRSLALAWTEASLQYLHALSCEDPLTGLSSLAHVRSRLAEIYREADLRGAAVTAQCALVMVEVLEGSTNGRDSERFERVLRLASAAECLRAVYSGGETLGRFGLDRAGGIVCRTETLGRSVALLRELLSDSVCAGGSPVLWRVWIEPLPEDNDAAARLLSELAR